MKYTGDSSDYRLEDEPCKVDLLHVICRIGPLISHKSIIITQLLILNLMPAATIDHDNLQ